MRFSCAPMEGLTARVFRKAFVQHFPNNLRFYSPFISPTSSPDLSSTEMKDVQLADNQGIDLVPQILSNHANEFLFTVEKLQKLGYTEVNLNLGCPSGTVTARGRGSGFLKRKEELKAFLDEIYAGSPLPISIKTRIGFYEKDEFPAILELYNRYPVKELTIHPRIRAQFYKGSVDMDSFRYALEHSKNPLCYNGDLISLKKVREFGDAFPQVESVMIGRGLVGDPGMLSPGGTDMAALEAFYDELFAVYTDVFGGTRNAMFRLKENWRHLLCKFEGSEKLGKRLKKTTDAGEYKSLTHEIFRTLPLRDEIQPDW